MAVNKLRQRQGVDSDVARHIRPALQRGTAIVAVQHDNVAGDEATKRRSEGDGEGKSRGGYVYMEPYRSTHSSLSQIPASPNHHFSAPLLATHSILWSSMLITPIGGWYYG